MLGKRTRFMRHSVVTKVRLIPESLRGAVGGPSSEGDIIYIVSSLTERQTQKQTQRQRQKDRETETEKD